VEGVEVAGSVVDLPDPDGELFARVDDDISPGHALTLQHAGALVAWDACRLWWVLRVRLAGRRTSAGPF
jgi:hypothetical protein